MAWYYYSGNVARPIKVREGLSKSVKPHSKVEIQDMDHATRALKNKGLLVRTSRPKSIKPVGDGVGNEKNIEDVVVKSKLAMAIAEKGKTIDPAIAPVSVSGAEVTAVEETLAQRLSEASNEDTQAPVEEADSAITELKDDDEKAELVESGDSVKVKTNKKGRRK